MLLEIGLIAAGVPVGHALRGSARAKRYSLPALTATVWFILFTQGLKLGGDERLAAQAGMLGARAAALWLLGMLFSSLFAFAVAAFRFKDALTAPDPGRGKTGMGPLKGSACVLACFLGGCEWRL